MGISAFESYFTNNVTGFDNITRGRIPLIRKQNLNLENIIMTWVFYQVIGNVTDSNICIKEAVLL